MAKKPNFRHDFDPFGPNLGPQNFGFLSLHDILRKTYDPNSKCQ